MDYSAEYVTPKLRELAKQGIYIGTSSWKYEGWIGQVYTGDYSGPRSKIVKKRFETECLAEYATKFPTVCLDEAYYRFPDPQRMEFYASQVPDDFRFALKVTKFVTERYDFRTKEYNESYLNATMYKEHFWEPVKSTFGDKLGPVIFEFSPFFFGKWNAQKGYSPDQFVVDLHKFLSEIPKDGAKIGVEIRDEPILSHPKYLSCLQYHHVAHTLNEQTWMPEFSEQLKVEGIFPTDYAVIRALVRPGVKHNEAVDEFQPYDRTQLVRPSLREGLAEAVKLSSASKRGLYTYVNNRTEGNAPNTIRAVLELLDGQD